MSDVYKFRVTVDLELATHESPKKVRDYLKEQVECWLFEHGEAPRGDVVEEILRSNVRTKRLDDWASIDPPVKLTLPSAKCPHCAYGADTPVEIRELPLRCPLCRKVIPIDGEGRVRE